jgi:hypothetical protein
MNWQPIDTAPNDGTWILLYGGNCGEDEYDGGSRIVSAQWTRFLNGQKMVKGHWQFAWFDGGYYGEYKNPTHWMPLPAGPDK